jgi:hypothetical protein
LSGDLESVAGVADFRLIDPPRVSPKPVAPNRLVLMPGVFLLSLIAGLGVGFVASQLRPVFMDAKSLRTQTGLPLLGSISRVMNATRTAQRKADHRRFLTGLASLLLTFSVVLGVMFFRAAGG